MTKINANSLRVGNIINHDKKLFIIVSREHTKPGKGGAFIQVEMKDFKSSTKLYHKFRSTENVELVRLEQVVFSFLYKDDNLVTLMNNETFEQIELDVSLFGDDINFLQDNMPLEVNYYESEPISVTLPETVELEIKEADAARQTAAASYKPATLSNDVRIMVPPFINAGDIVSVRIEDKQYLERVKKN